MNQNPTDAPEWRPADKYLSAWKAMVAAMAAGPIGEQRLLALAAKASGIVSRPELTQEVLRPAVRADLVRASPGGHKYVLSAEPTDRGTEVPSEPYALAAPPTATTEIAATGGAGCRRPPAAPEGLPGPSILSQVAPALLPHQAGGRDWLLDHPGTTAWSSARPKAAPSDRKALLADAVGLGKTVTALAYVNALRERGELDGPGVQVLILTEGNPLIRQYLREIAAWCPWATAGTSLDKAHKPTAWNPGADEPTILVCTYAWAHSRVDALSGLSPNLVICDEVSAVDGGGKQHESVRRLTADAPRVVGMTATVYENNPVELHNILTVIGTPDLWPRPEYDRRFVDWDNTDPTNPKARGWLTATAKAEMVTYLAVHGLARTPVDVGVRLPVRVGDREPRLVPLSAAQHRAYEKADRRTDQGRTMRMSAVSVHLNGRSSLVDAGVAEILRRPGQKAVVFSEHLAPLTIAEAALDRAGVTYIRVDGSTSEAGRQDAVTAFADPDGPQVILGTRVIERGLNLQCARVLISIEGTTWNPGRLIQREGRVCRIGSPHETYEHIVLMPDTDLARAQVGVRQRKAANAEALMG